MKRRWVRWTVGILLGLLVGVPFLGWVWLHSSWGRAFARQQVLELTRTALPGTLKLASLEVGLTSVHATGLQLFTPEGELVAQLDVLDASYSLGTLIQKSVTVHRAELTRPRLLLVDDERGLNLVRAVSAGESADGGTSSGPGGWTVKVDALALIDGAVDYRDDERHLAAEHLGARGLAKVELEPLAIQGQLTLAAVATAPVKGPLVLESSVDTHRSSELSVQLADFKLRASGEVDRRTLSLEELVAPEQLVRAFLPSWPLEVPLKARGEASASHAQVELEAGSARVKASGDWTLEPLSFRGVQLSAKSVQLQELLGVPLSSTLEVDASGAITDPRPESLEGQLELNGTWTAPGGRSLATVRARAKAEKGSARFEPLVIEAPGVALSATGTASPSTLGLEGTLTASELSRLPAALRDFLGVSLPALGGTGSLKLSASGPLTHPSATLSGSLRGVRVASVSAARLEVDARVPDVLKPFDASANLDVQQVLVGGQTLERVKLRAITEGRALQVDLGTKGQGELCVHLGALLDQDLRGARLDALNLDSATWAWALEQPAQLRWGDGLELGLISLRDQEQHLRVQGTQQRGTFEGQLELDHLALHRIPSSLVPASLGLGGVLSASAQVRLPDAKGSLEWTRGAVAGVSAIEARANVSYEKDRLHATLEGSSTHGQVKLEAEVPVQAVLRQRAEPLTAHLSASGLELDRLGERFAAALPVHGAFAVDATVGGTGAKPTLELSATAEKLTVDYRTSTGEILALVKPKLLVHTRDDQTLSAELDLLLFDGTVHASLDSPFTLAGLRAHPPTLEALQRATAHLELAATDVDLLALDTMRVVDAPGLGGKLTLLGSVDGSLLEPVAALTLTGAKLRVPPLAPLELSAKVEGDARRAKLTATVAPASGKPLELDAQLDAGLRQLAEPQTLGSRPVTVKVKAPELDLAALVEPDEASKRPAGTIDATASLLGTLDAPRLSLQASMRGLRFRKTELGTARLEVKGTAEGQQLTLGLGGAEADQLEVNGRFGLPLSLARLRTTKVADAPLDVTATAKGLDLTFLSGVTPEVRALGGTLDLAGTAKGRVGSPTLLGEAHWKDGRLALMGFGDYRELALDVKATNDRVDLSKLVAHAGGGDATIEAHLARAPDGTFHLTASAETSRFPIVSDDQLLATASTKLTVRGEVSPSLIDLSSVEIPRADVRLPEVKRKDLQDLQRPDDIVILGEGHLTTRQRLRKVAGGSSGPTIRLRLDAPRNLWVRSSDLNVELGLSDGFLVELADGPQISGTASLLRGELSVIGRKFTVQKNSTVRFSGNPLEPDLDVTAVHVNDSQKVTVTVTAVGRGTNVALKASSDPPLSETDIYTLIATGRLKLERGSGASLTPEDAASVVGQFAASQLKTMLAKKLPIDVLNFEALDNFNNFKFDIGKYLSDRVYLGVTAQTGANPARGENPWAGRIEYQMSKSWSLEAYAGTAPAAGADVLWTRDF